MQPGQQGNPIHTLLLIAFVLTFRLRGIHNSLLRGIMVDLIPNRMSSRKILMVLLVAAVRFLAKNITDFLIVASLIEGYMLIASTDAIATPFLFISNY